MLVVSASNAKKPDNKPEPQTETEWIAFDEDLLGGQEVEGCCPNAGPWVQYEMYFPNGLGDLVDPEEPSVPYNGYLFINYFGAGRNQEYLVRFVGSNSDGEQIAIEIVGGVIEKDKKTKVLTVAFTNEDCRYLVEGCPTPGCGDVITYVTFTLTRTPL